MFFSKNTTSDISKILETNILDVNGPKFSLLSPRCFLIAAFRDMLYFLRSYLAEEILYTERLFMYILMRTFLGTKNDKDRGNFEDLICFAVKGNQTG